MFFEGSTLVKPSILPEDQCIQIPILPVTGLVLFPGQMLPLNLFDAREMSIIRHALNGDKVVGILTTKYVCHCSAVVICNFYTTRFMKITVFAEMIFTKYLPEDAKWAAVEKLRF